MNRASVILLCITTIVVFYIIDKKPTIDIAKYETQINILQQQIILLETVNDSLELESKELEKAVAAFDVKINNLNRDINVIKKETKAQLDAIDYNSTKEINALVKLISVTNDKLVTQSDLVSNLKSQTFTLNNIITQKDSQIKTAAEMSDDLQSALKKANRQKKLYQIGSAIGGGAVLLLLIQ